MSRLFVKSDSKNLKQFIDNVYGKNHILNNKSHSDWQFNKNPFNKFQKSIMLTTSNSEISCYVGLFPIELKVFNKIEKANG